MNDKKAELAPQILFRGDVHPDGGALYGVSVGPLPDRTVTMSLSEADRQMVLLSLAHLSIERPGWEPALHALALQIDNQSEGRAVLFDGFRKLKR
jgi:hypothetical protein